MLTDPGLTEAIIIECLRERFGLSIAQVSFLPLGYITSAVYQAATDDGTCYLQLSNQFLPNNVVDIAHRTYQRARQPEFLA